MVTTMVGSLVGAGLGALVGRLIAMFGDQTIQTSVPVVFCGALGFFVGGASAAKGSLERFGAKRTGLGTTVAAVILVGLVGGAFLSRAAGSVVFVVAVVATALAGLASAAVGAPQDAPVARPGARAPAKSDAPERPRPPAPEPAPPPMPAPTIRKVAVPRRPEPIDEPEPKSEPSRPDANWNLDENDAGAAPPSRPRRDRPLRKGDA